MTEIFTTSLGDPEDTAIRAQIARNEREAKKALSALFHKFRKKPEGEQFEAVMNVVGIMSAEVIGIIADFDQSAGGHGGAEQVAKALKSHIDNALERRVPR
ncbi:MAG: hypothetical protein AAF479_10635 [Pseudomonadota bacterium]